MIFIPPAARKFYEDHYESFLPLRSGTELVSSDLNETEFLFIGFTNRCGSNFLAEALASGGSLNVASEFLNEQEIISNPEFEKETFNLCEYFSGVSLNDMKDGLFALKSSIEHFVLLGVSGIISELLSRSHFVHVERSDKISQAISYVIASQKGQWASYQDAVKSEANFDFGEIHNAASIIAEKNRLLEEFYEKNDIKPLRLVYEDFENFPAAAVEKVSHYIGRQIAFDQTAIRTHRQSDQQNLLWRERYVDMIRADLERI